jgi:hypothetical protein
VKKEIQDLNGGLRWCCSSDNGRRFRSPTKSMKGQVKKARSWCLH